MAGPCGAWASRGATRATSMWGRCGRAMGARGVVVVVVCRGVVHDVGGSWVGAARAVRAALGGEIAQETPWVDLEALVLHKSGCVWFKKGDIQRTLNKN